MNVDRLKVIYTALLEELIGCQEPEASWLLDIFESLLNKVQKETGK